MMSHVAIEPLAPPVAPPRAPAGREGPGNRFGPVGYAHCFFDEEPLLGEVARAGLVVTARHGFIFVLREAGQSAAPEHPAPFAFELARVVRLVRRRRCQRRGSSPREVRWRPCVRAGATRPRAGPWVARGCDAPSAGPMPSRGGASCYRRVLLEESRSTPARRANPSSSASTWGARATSRPKTMTVARRAGVNANVRGAHGNNSSPLPRATRHRPSRWRVAAARDPGPARGRVAPARTHGLHHLTWRGATPLGIDRAAEPDHPCELEHERRAGTGAADWPASAAQSGAVPRGSRAQPGPRDLTERGLLVRRSSARSPRGRSNRRAPRPAGARGGATGGACRIATRPTWLDSR